MSLTHLKQREQAAPDRVAFSIQGKTGGRFAEAFAFALNQQPALKELHPEIRSYILEIDRRDDSAAVAEAFDAIVGQALDIVSHDREIAAQARQLEESQRIDLLQRFKKENEP